MDAVIAGATMALLAASVLFQVDDLRRDARERRDVEELLRLAAAGAGDPAVAARRVRRLRRALADWSRTRETGRVRWHRLAALLLSAAAVAAAVALVEASLGAAMLLGLAAGWTTAGTRAVLGSRTHRARIEELVACAGLHVPVQRLRRPA